MAAYPKYVCFQTAIPVMSRPIFGESAAPVHRQAQPRSTPFRRPHKQALMSRKNMLQAVTYHQEPQKKYPTLCWIVFWKKLSSASPTKFRGSYSIPRFSSVLFGPLCDAICSAGTGLLASLLPVRRPRVRRPWNISNMPTCSLSPWITSGVGADAIHHALVEKDFERAAAGRTRNAQESVGSHTRGLAGERRYSTS